MFSLATSLLPNGGKKANYTVLYKARICCSMDCMQKLNSK